MKAKSKADWLSVRLVHMEILLALALLGVVFLTAAHSDTVSARQQMATTIQYIQEQCNRYNRIELASETKSLMRVMESVGHIARQMAADGEESAPLSEYAQMGYVSGLIVMDETGFVLSDYHGTGEAPRQLGEYLDSPALLDAALYPEKCYATRFVCADGSMIDLAAVGRRDAPGIVAAYYRTPVEYLDAFRGTARKRAARLSSPAAAGSWPATTRRSLAATRRKWRFCGRFVRRTAAVSWCARAGRRILFSGITA